MRRPNILVVLSDEHTASAAGWAGQYVHQIGAWDNGVIPGPSFRTWGLREAGYTSVIAGRTHFNGPDQLLGFDRRLAEAVLLRARRRHPSAAAPSVAVRGPAHPPQVFSVDNDPSELHDLSTHESLVAKLDTELRSIVDPDRIDVLAKSDQAARLDERTAR
jgi:arylsulfatase A-like enzyme